MNSSTPEAGLARMRQEYALGGLTEAELAADWVAQFGQWLAEAAAAGVAEPNAMTFATATPEGRPSTRTVLLKAYDLRGFVLFTNYGSRKATEALGNPYASLVFFWYPLHRQVVVCGSVEPVTRAETAEYFAQRPRGAQLAAWASPQSRVLGSRDELEGAWGDAAARWPEPSPVPAPEHWGGLRVVPETVEFWQGRENRMHDRLRYRRTDSRWVIERLAP